MAGVREFQQGSRCHRTTWINVILGILPLLLPCVQHGGAQLQALSQMSSVVEVWQAEDADPVVPTQVNSVPNLLSCSSFYVPENGRPLRFQPPSLEFGTQPLGLPRAETIYIHNPSQEIPVTLLSMFTSSRHFHMPSFHRRVIPPRGKASFKLVFLPTEEGIIENSLFINTSAHGVLSYQVLGLGVHRGSLKGVYRKDSVLIFPHIQSIKLSQTQEDSSNITILGLLLECSLPKSIYSQPQGLNLQIRLSEHTERPADMDKLKPYVIEHILVLLVAPATDAVTPRELNIGICMLNSGGKKLYVKEMQLLSKVDSALEFSPVLLRTSATNFTQVATLACRGSLPGQGRRCSSHISLLVLGNHTVNTFPGFHSTHRGLELSNLFQVRQRQKGADHVDLWLTNTLHFPLTVQDAILSPESQGLLKVVNFSGAVSVPQGGCWRILSLQLLNRSLPLNLLSTLSLTTGLCLALKLPLHFHSTLAKVILPMTPVCRVQWQRSLLPDSSSWMLDSRLASELCARWQIRKDQLPCRWPRLPAETSSPLDFGAVPVNESKVKLLTLKNPSSSVVYVEIRALSLYPAPLEALDLLTKWFNISPLSVNISTTEFTLLPAEHKGVLRLLLQPWESREVAVVFTPSEHKPTTTILLIRNNLTVFDMVTVRGHGSKELLRVGGKLPGPGASLRFNVPQSTLMECRDGLRANKPLFAIRKSFKVENAGELPLTVTSMNINGYKCQGFGFEVLQCRSFSLDHNSSSEITIAFTPDFTSSWVIRDLTLVTSRGSLFPFTLNVTLPHHMLPLCAQVVPRPSWEETFWVVTLIFTCFSLAGVCLMAFHQAQYILSQFSSPTTRSIYNSALSRDNGPVNNINPNGVNKMKGSCKTYVETCHNSDKGKGRGSPALANGSTPRPQPFSSSSSSKKGASTTPSQPQKKHKVSVYYGKYKTSSSATAVTVPEEELELDLTPDLGTLEPYLSTDACNNNEPTFLCQIDVKKTTQHFKEAHPQSAAQGEDSKGPAAVMFPVETQAGFPDNVTVGPGPRPGLLLCSPVTEKGYDLGTHSQFAEKRDTTEKRDNSELEVIHRSSTSLALLPVLGVCLVRPRRKCVERRMACESGSDSGSSSGSVRASRGSWGSWSSASSVEGDKDPDNPRHRTHHCTTSARKSMNALLQYARSHTHTYTHTALYTTHTQAHFYLYTEYTVHDYFPEETWSAPSVPLTNEFRYNASEAVPYVPQASAPFNGFPWNSANSQCNSPYAYCGQGYYMSAGNTNFHNSFPCQPESQAVAYSHRPSWSEECSQEAPSTWDTAGCVGSKPYFPGTRSLSPMSSLFGSIWTPQSEPYQSHFQPERSVPMSPVSPVCPITPPHAPFNREPGGMCRPKQYSSFNPFGPHMNLDIWNSSSNRSSNSQLSNDSGYCGDV
uniref:Transmembrane protein 131-like n=1 Tax=Oncorhynchus tshawytscha TaxID=74940 RepID=A0AAZ3S0P4_ONCTS